MISVLNINASNSVYVMGGFFVAEREEKRFETETPYMQVSVSPNAFQQYNRKGDLNDAKPKQPKTMANPNL